MVFLRFCLFVFNPVLLQSLQNDEKELTSWCSIHDGQIYLFSSDDLLTEWFFIYILYERSFVLI